MLPLKQLLARNLMVYFLHLWVKVVSLTEKISWKTALRRKIP